MAVAGIAIGAVALTSGPANDKETDNREVVNVTDLMGNSVDVKYPAKRVVLGSMDEVDLYAAVYGEGWEKTVVMWPADIDSRDPTRNTAYFSKYPSLKDLPKSPDLFAVSAFPLEIMLKEKPDLVLLPAGSIMWRQWNATTWKPMTDAGIGVVTLDMYTDPYGKIGNNVDVLGKITKKTERANGINTMFNNNIKIVSDIMKDIPNSKKGLSIYIEISGADPLQFGSSPGMGTPEFTMIGGTNLAQEYCKKNSIQYTSDFCFNFEKLKAENPDAIFFAMSTYYGSKEAKLFGFNQTSSESELRVAADKYLSRPGFDTLDAVKDKRAFMYIAEIRNTFASFANLQIVAKALYPTEFKDVDPYANLMAFNSTYLPAYTGGTFFYDMCKT